MTTATQTLPQNGQANTGLLAQALTTGPKLPSRVVLHAPEKWGKTSFAAHAPKPFFLCSNGESGLETLIDNGLLAPTPHFNCTAWPEVTSWLRALAMDDHDYKTLVLDVGNGFSRMAEAHICETKFGGNWSESGYASYGAGVKATVAPWEEFRDLLDKIRARKRMAILMLCHTGTKTCTNPEGPAYDRYQPDMPNQLWGVINKWADVIMLGQFHVVTEAQRGGKAKGRGGEARVIYTQPTATRIAGGRHRLPPVIHAGDSPAAAWTAFVQAMKHNAT